MDEKDFRADVRTMDGKVVIDLMGEIDSFAESKLSDAYQEALATEAGSVVLNFERVGYINSTGIALIVSLLAQARKMHQKMVVFGLNDHYLEIFRITRLADFMTICEDEASALAV